MSINLTCTQVSALLSFYIDDKLNCQLKQFVEAHLEVCPTCAAKLEALKGMVDSLKAAHKKLSTIKSESEDVSENPLYDEFKVNLSAYIDNELSDEENIKVKKYIISNSKARNDLEKFYNLKKVLHNSFEKTKNDVKDDYSKYILKRIDIQEEVYGPDSFVRVATLCVALLGVLTFIAIVLFGV